MNMKQILLVFLGGGIGSSLRYGIQMLLSGREFPWGLPWATLSVNILGSFMIGLFYALSGRWGLSPDVRLLLTTGLCGGFTTFSTLSNDALSLLRSGLYASFALYVALSLILGLGAVYLGYLAAGK